MPINPSGGVRPTEGNAIMKPDPAKLAQLWTAMINDMLMFEWKRLGANWEPRLDAALTAMVDESLKLASQAAGVPPDQAKQALKAPVLDAAKQGLLAGQAILRDMAREQFHTTIDIMTMRGFLLKVTPFASSAEEDRAVAELAGGQALAVSVGKSCGEFLQRLGRALDDAKGEPPALPVHLDAVGRWWRARLTTIGHTIMYAVANDVRKTVAEEY